MAEQPRLDKFVTDDNKVDTSANAIQLKYLARVNPAKSEVSNLPSDTQVSFVPLKDFSTDGEITNSETKQLSEVYDGYTYFREGDIALAKITPSFENGKGAICRGLKNDIGFGTTELHILRPREGVDPQFIWYILRSKNFREKAKAAMRGVAGQKRIPSDFLENYKISSLSLAQQKQISNHLEKRIKPIKQLIKKKESLINILKRRRQAVLTRTVTGYTSDGCETTDTDVDWLGRIPCDWAISPLKYQVSFESGKTPNKSNEDYWDGEIPWITAKDMKCDFLSSSQDQISQKAITETGIQLYEPETVVLVVRGMILDHTFPVALLNKHATINQDLKALIAKKTLNPEYLLRLLNGLSPIVLSITEESAHGTKKLDMDQLRNLRVPIPPISTQEYLIEQIDNDIRIIDELIHKTKTSIELLREKRQALITAAVTGQINIT